MTQDDFAWNTYQKRKRWFFVWFFSFPFIMGSALLFEQKLGLKITFPWLGLAYFVIVNGYGIRWLHFVCPNCGMKFHIDWFYHNPFNKNCLHCGFPGQSSRA